MVSESARLIFKRNLHRIAKDRNMSQVEIANALKLTPSTVSGWFLGTRYPRIDVMQRLADLLEVSMRDLITENGDDLRLSFDEKHVINLYRKLNIPGKEYILQTLMMAIGNETFTAEDPPVSLLGDQAIK